MHLPLPCVLVNGGSRDVLNILKQPGMDFEAVETGAVDYSSSSSFKTGGTEAVGNVLIFGSGTLGTDAAECILNLPADLTETQSELRRVPLVREESGKVPGTLSNVVALPCARDEMQLTFMQAMDLPADLRHDILNADGTGIEEAVRCVTPAIPDEVAEPEPEFDIWKWL